MGTLRSCIKWEETGQVKEERTVSGRVTFPCVEGQVSHHTGHLTGADWEILDQSV